MFVHRTKFYIDNNNGKWFLITTHTVILAYRASYNMSQMAYVAIRKYLINAIPLKPEVEHSTF